MNSESPGASPVADLRQRCDTALQCLSDARYRAQLARLFDDLLAAHPSAAPSAATPIDGVIPEDGKDGGHIASRIERWFVEGLDAADLSKCPYAELTIAERWWRRGCCAAIRRPSGELVARLRLLEADHAPDGWPAVRMRDITALLDASAAPSAEAIALEKDARRLWHDYIELSSNTAPQPSAAQGVQEPRADHEGTFACPVCGVSTPHWHDPKEADRIKIENNVIRPAFEAALTNLCHSDPFGEALRVSGWGSPTFWNRHPYYGMFSASYEDNKLEAMWRLFRSAWQAAGAAPVAPIKDSTLAMAFHEAYERLAPKFGYATRAETREFDPDSPNGKLMIAVIREMRADLASPSPQVQPEPIKALFARLLWPHGYGEVSQFRAFKPDPTNLHAPWFLAMPGGSLLELNHCADDAVDEARCRWMVDALNRALSAHPVPEEAAQARMLTAEETMDAFSIEYPDEGPSPQWMDRMTAVCRKFCEVNGIALSDGTPASHSPDGAKR